MPDDVLRTANLQRSSASTAWGRELAGLQETAENIFCLTMYSANYSLTLYFSHFNIRRFFFYFTASFILLMRRRRITSYCIVQAQYKFYDGDDDTIQYNIKTYKAPYVT